MFEDKMLRLLGAQDRVSNRGWRKFYIEQVHNGLPCCWTIRLHMGGQIEQGNGVCYTRMC